MRIVVSEDQVEGLIKGAFPDFKIESIKLEGVGWDNSAFAVNGDYIFRFPQYEAVLEYVEREISLLPKLNEILPVPVPNIEFVGEREAGGSCFQRFIGYKRLPGDRLDKKQWARLDSKSKTLAAKEIAGVLDALHNFSTEAAIAMGIGREHHRKKANDFLATAKKSVFPLLAPSEQEGVERNIQAYLEDDSCLDYTPAVLHADLSAEHVLWDETKGHLSGILDWGDVVIGDPDFDLAGPYAVFGSDFIHRILEFWPRKNLRILFKKLNAFAVMGMINNLANHPRKDEEAIREEHLSQLRDTLRGL